MEGSISRVLLNVYLICVFRVWNNISVKQNGYLVQISQPGDVLPNILSSVAIMQNMTNAAVFYDSSISKGSSLPPT